MNEYCNTKRSSSLAMVALLFWTSQACSDERKSFDPAAGFDMVELFPADETAMGVLAAQDSSGEIAEVIEEANDARINTALIDLNGDNKPEVVLELKSLETCGIRDCQIVILEQDGDQLKPIFEANASSLALGEKDQSGWRELITNPDLETNTGAVWGREGGRYEIR